MDISIWTREELTSLLADYKAAYQSASTGKSYSIDGRTLTRQDIPEIQRQLTYLQAELAALMGKKRGPVIVQARVRR